MEPAEFDRLAQTEEQLWWFRAQHRNILATLDRLVLPAAKHDCIDVGCGTGGLVRKLESQRPDWKIVGIDLSERALEYARRSSDSEFIEANGMELPFEDSSVASIVSLDVLCHKAVETEPFLAEMKRVLKKGGHVILSNPAYEWTRSYHDEHVHTARRYTMKRIGRDLEKAGFKVESVGHWNTVLFPLMVLKRKILTGKGEASDVHEISKLLNTLFDNLTKPEAFLLRRGAKLPFGGSVLAVGVKP